MKAGALVVLAVTIMLSPCLKAMESQAESFIFRYCIERTGTTKKTTFTHRSAATFDNVIKSIRKAEPCTEDTIITVASRYFITGSRGTPPAIVIFSASSDNPPITGYWQEVLGKCIRFKVTLSTLAQEPK